MDDARNLQYGIGFDTADAETSVENLGEKVETLEENIGAVEVGAQQMGASAVSACQMGQGAAERFTGAVGDASGGLDDMASSASKAGNAAQKAAGHWNMTAEGLEWVEEAAQAAEAAAESFRDEMDDSGGAAGRFRAQIKKTAESAQDMGPAFKGAMADGLDAGQSIAKSFRTGVTGAMDFTKKRAEIFANNMVRNAKNISKAFQHPIKIIRSGLVSALRRAKKSEDETADGADDAGDHLAEMGAAGEDAGNQIKEAISGAVKAFVGFEAIKSGIELLKQFGAAAVSAFSDAESTSKKFGRSFSEEAAAWADNYADAVHRSTAEVQSFMVSNKAMYNELGITAAAAENLSEMTTSLAYDFGNAFSMDDSEALSLIQSAIGGSTDALNEYGIVLDKTALKNSAAALGLGTNIDALDDAAMAQVRLNAILEQSGDIQKAAVEQTGGLTNSIKSLKGEMADFMADAGEKFSPALEDMVGVFLDEWPELEPTLLEFVGILADGMSAAVPVISNLAQSILPSLISTLGTLFDAAGPVLSIIGDTVTAAIDPEAIATVAAVNDLLQRHNEDPEAHAGIIMDAVSSAMKKLEESGQIMDQKTVETMIRKEIAEHGSGGYYGTYFLTLAASGWEQADEESPDYSYIYTAELPDSTSALIPSGAPLLGSFHIAEDAGVVNGCETGDGVVKFYSKEVPAADISTCIILFGKGGGGESDLTVATREQLGHVKIGNGIEVTEDGTISANAKVSEDQIATSDDTSEMLKEIYGE